MKAQTEYERRMANGILPWDDAAPLIAHRARAIRFDAWQLNIEPIDLPIQRRMGIRHPIDIRHKFLHLFPVLIDEAGNELLALHTMPVDPAAPDRPDTMGATGTKIRLFAMTPDASNTRFEREKHKLLPATEILSITKPAGRAALVTAFAQNLAALNHDYTVPVGPVRREFMQALGNATTLPRHPVLHANDRIRRRIARTKLEALDDMTLVQHLRVHCTQPLDVHGFNSNSGAEALRQLFDYPALPYNAAEAPFVEHSLLEGQGQLLAQLERLNREPERVAVAMPAPKRPHSLWHNLVRRLLPRPLAVPRAA